jgi:hypothetical protein
MQPDSKPPAGDGDTASWFRYYKWAVEGETFVPVHGRDPLPVGAGDMVWFAMGSKILGGAPILRVEVEFSRQLQEIWYNADDILELHPPQDLVLLASNPSEEEVAKWLQNAHRRPRN